VVVPVTYVPNATLTDSNMTDSIIIVSASNLARVCLEALCQLHIVLAIISAPRDLPDLRNQTAQTLLRETLSVTYLNRYNDQGTTQLREM
jgi:hypothetical protein